MRKDNWPRLVGSWRASMALKEESGAGDRIVVVSSHRECLRQ